MNVETKEKWGKDGRILCGNVRDVLRQLKPGIVQMAVTSPPYWMVRDFELPDQIWGGDPYCRHKRWDRENVCTQCDAWRGSLGLEPTIGRYLKNMVEVFDGVYRVMRDDGTLWLNMGDVYASKKTGFFKPKDLVGQSWLLATALQKAGWYLRQDIIWSKPNPTPESCTDRPTKAHEYLFLMTKQPHYYYDCDAIRERPKSDAKALVKAEDFHGGTFNEAGHLKPLVHGKQVGFPSGIRKEGKNKRSVWDITTQPFPKAHFATFPYKLIQPCILAGTSKQACGCGAPMEPVREFLPDFKSRLIDFKRTCKCPDSAGIGKCIVLDPFAGGSGRVAQTSLRWGRRFLMIEISEKYCNMMRDEIDEWWRNGAR